MTEDFQFWPLGRPIPDGWEFASYLDRHHSHHAILIGRINVRPDTLGRKEAMEHAESPTAETGD